MERLFNIQKLVGGGEKKQRLRLILCFANQDDAEMQIFQKMNAEMPESKQVELFFNKTPTTIDLVKTFQPGQYDAICGFVNDDFSRPVLEHLAKIGIKIVALRCAGFDRVDKAAAKELGIKVVRVPAYNPMGVAEHGVTLMCALNRKIHLAHKRILMGNFTHQGLMGQVLHGKTMGIIGGGRIGICFGKITNGFGMKNLIYDVHQIKQKDLQDTNGTQVDLETLLKNADFITIHTPLFPSTKHLINKNTIKLMKKSVIVVNVARGPLVNSDDMAEAIKNGDVAGYCADVIDGEGPYFFKDHQSKVIKHDTMLKLLSYPNVLIVPHQGALFVEAWQEIAKVTISNIYEIKTKGTAGMNDVA